MKTCPKEDLSTKIYPKNPKLGVGWGGDKTSIKRRMEEHVAVYPNSGMVHSKKNKHEKVCSTVISEMQIKISEIPLHTNRMATSKG